MLADPNESWWVVDGSLMATSFSSARDVSNALPLNPARADQEAKFPAHPFLFAGSGLWGEGPGPRR